MLRLRTSSSLSALALAIGIAGTGWLSSLTSGWSGPPPQRLAAARRLPPRARASSPSRTRDPISRVQSRRRGNHRAASEATAPEVASRVPLHPVAMPSDSSSSWDSLRGHLDGRVLLHVDIDGHGDVRDAQVTESSGDPVLDQHALRSVRGWRFAVPADHPQGISGELPMRFSSHAESAAGKG